MRLHKDFIFTFINLKKYYEKAIDLGYMFISCEDYIEYKNSTKKIIVNRVDIDQSMTKAKRLTEIFNSLNIKGSFFIRLHANDYNPFSFENHRILKFIRDSGHEIGYHSEVVDEATIWEEDPIECLKRDIKILNEMLDINITGVASHGGGTGLNNLTFWDNHSPEDFGLKYEAYDSRKFDLFNNSFYISDSNWTFWKCYNNGIHIVDDKRTFGEHLDDDHKLIYLLIHPETYYDEHFYE